LAIKGLKPGTSRVVMSAPPPTNPTAWNAQGYQSNPSVAAPPSGKSNATFAVFVTVFVMLLLFSMVGIGAWFFYRGAAHDPNANILLAKGSPTPQTANRATTTEANTSKTIPAATPSTAVNANTANTAPAYDVEQIKREVAQRVDSWKSAAEALDLDGYMSHYAATVNYYNKSGASRNFVRADKERAFTAYDSITINITNITVTPVPNTNGNRATAVFDKEWNFSNAEKTNSGKVRQKLELRKENGRWLIDDERDLQVYDTR